MFKYNIVTKKQFSLVSLQSHSHVHTKSYIHLEMNCKVTETKVRQAKDFEGTILRFVHVLECYVSMSMSWLMCSYWVITKGIIWSYFLLSLSCSVWKNVLMVLWFGNLLSSVPWNAWMTCFNACASVQPAICAAHLLVWWIVVPYN